MTEGEARPAAQSGGLLAAVRRRFRVDDDLAYILPMAVFCGITALQQIGPQWVAPCYAAKTLLVPWLLIILWPHFDKISWKYWQWGVVMGVVGVIQWVVMGKAMLRLDLLNRLFAMAGYHPSTAGPTVSNPFEEIHSSALVWPFIVVRLMGPTLLVPFVEEFFWRDYIWRRITSPNDFRLVSLGEWDAQAFWLVPLFFMTVHDPSQWGIAFVWGVMIGLLLLRTKSLGACIVMHGVTNFLLGVYVLLTHDWFFW